jgi:hypothetical protein
MGLTEEAVARARKRSGNRRGRKHLEERSDEVDALFERLEDLKPRGQGMAGPAIGRAVKNLMTALSHRVS